MTTSLCERSESSASTNLLSRVRASEARAWQRFAALYSPWVYRLARRAGLRQSDAADVSQEVFMTAALRMDSFQRDLPGQSMRRWLGQITRNKLGDWMRLQATVPIAYGGDDSTIDRLNAVPSPELFNEEFEDDLSLLRRAIELIRTDFEESTWQCFRQIVLEDRTAVDVAQEIGMTPRAVRQAKYRVIRRLREEFEGILELDPTPSLSCGAQPIPTVNPG